MKTLLLILVLTGNLFAQIPVVERPKVPTDTTLASKTSQIAAWYRYAVYVEQLLAEAKAGTNNDPSNLIIAKLNNIEQYLKWSARAIVTIKTNIILSWTDNSNNETSFIVERSTNGINFITIATLPANTISYTDIGLDPGEYYYRASSFNASGVGLSTIISIR